MAARLPVHAYVHVPFCRARCRYCDFHSGIGSAEAMSDYLAALETEIGNLPHRPRLRTVFLGGGTPTSLPPPLLARFLGILSAGFRLDSLEEYTVEANPGTLTAQGSELLLEAGVNRVSVGIQTFEDRQLRFLGRVHDANTAHEALRSLRAAGVENLSLDLIFGIPGSDLDTLRRDLDEALRHEPEHLSVYGLSIEPGTTFDRWRKDGRLSPCDDEAMAVQFETTHEVLTEAGYRHYEISSYARPGFESRHNQGTWRNAAYLGFGPAAASFVGGERRRNVTSTPEYVRRLEDGEDPVEERESLSPRRAAGETLMLALRTADGITAGEVRRRHGVDPLVRYRRPIARFVKAGLMTVKRRRLRLTVEGWLVADAVLSTFVDAPRR